MKPFGLGNVGNVGNLLKQAATEEIPESVTSGHRAAGWRKEQKPAGNWKGHNSGISSKETFLDFLERAEMKT